MHNNTEISMVELIITLTKLGGTPGDGGSRFIGPSGSTMVSLHFIFALACSRKYNSVSLTPKEWELRGLHYIIAEQEARQIILLY